MAITPSAARSTLNLPFWQKFLQKPSADGLILHDEVEHVIVGNYQRLSVIDRCDEIIR
ncbi:hypothetical protein [Lactobacillus equicursoris]|uniref:hypothetical protein n=1 Tax=Lactobacillus equicursoris TaxID=420645 RepID=UPI003996AA1E